MNYALGDALMIEVEELLAKVKVFDGGGATCSNLEGILVVGYRDALLSGQDRHLAAGGLMRFSAGADRHILITVLYCFSLA
jgi:hypothetical protein